MGKTLHNDVLDGSLNVLKTSCTRMTLCTQEPTTYTEGNATYALADVTMASGDFTVADGDVSGRKVTVAAKSAVPVDVSGTGNHVAYLDVTNSKLLGTNTCPSTAVTVGGTVNIASHKCELSAPS